MKSKTTFSDGTVAERGGTDGAGIDGSGSCSAGAITISNTATVFAVSDGGCSAVDSASGTAYALLANFSTTKSI